MGAIVKSVYFIDGVEVTSEHIGKKLKIFKSNDNHWLPVGFVTTIVGVRSKSVIDVQDIGGTNSYYTIDLDFGCWEFGWVTPVKRKKSSTTQQRQKLAKDIREAKMVLDTAVKEAEEVGMVVDISNDFVKITYNPPAETY